ncbi:MAG: LppX_LprAFG lipoprotein [Aeromicrobium sp.]
MLRRLTLLLALLLTAGLLAGCGDQHKPDQKSQRELLLGRLTAARAKIDKAETVHLTLAAKTLPDGTSGLLSATGSGNHSPAFTGNVKIITGGATVTAQVVAVGSEVMAKPSFAPIFLKVDPASLKAPNPAALFETATGFSQLLVEAKGLKEGAKSRDGKDVLTTITGHLPGSVVRAILPSADVASSFPVTYRLTDDNELRDASITGPFYPKVADVTYDISVATSSEPVSITLPK